MSPARTVLFVCTGNTCRSPMTEVLLRHLRPDLQAASGGVAAIEGSPATDVAREALSRLGMDLSSHRSRPVTPELLEWADQVVCMTRAHLEHLSGHFPESVPKLAVLRPLAGLAGHPDVRDPYGGDLETYLLCAQDLKEALSLAFGQPQRRQPS